MRTSTILGGAAALALLLAATRAPAAGNLHLGPVRVQPSLELRETYDSNIYLAPDGGGDLPEDSDWITTLTPALRLVLPLQRFQLQVHGQAEITRYADHDEENGTGADLGAALGAEFPGGLGFEVGDTYRWRYLTSTEEFGEGEDVEYNEARAKLSYAIREAFRAELAYFNYRFRYDLSTDRDRDEHIAQADFFWRFLPRTSALVELGFADYGYRLHELRNQDNTATQAAVGLTWEITSRSTGVVKAGYQWKRYAEEDAAAGIEDGEYFVLAANVLHFFTRRTVADLEVRRSSEESDFSANPYFLRTAVGAGLSQRFTAKLYGRVGAHWSRDSYPNDLDAATAYRGQTGERTDTLAGGDLTLGFDILRWLNLELRLAAASRTSTFDIFEYDVGRASFAVKASF